jgi:hypothetical protein
MMFASKAKWAAFGPPSFLLALDFLGAPGQSPGHEDPDHSDYRLHYYLLTQALAARSSSSEKFLKG